MSSSCTVVAIPVGSALEPSDARKRRREILAQQRGEDLVSPAAAPTPTASVESSPSAKKRKVVVSSDDESVEDVPSTAVARPKASSSTTKKPQMKYDPDVPMTKEEATAWRREQRRKRNRESAAASRQRQRDRIAELEVELQDWKTQYDAVMAKIRALEGQSPHLSNAGTASPARAEESPVLTSGLAAPPPPQPSSPTTSTFLDLAGDGLKASIPPPIPQGTTEQQQQLSPLKMISRPAVKITGDQASAVAAATTTIKDEEEEPSGLNPDPCVSVEQDDDEFSVDPEELLQVLDPIDASLFAIQDNDEECPPEILSAPEDEETEFGDFLLDAVDWL